MKALTQNRHFSYSVNNMPGRVMNVIHSCVCDKDTMREGEIEGERERERKSERERGGYKIVRMRVKM